MTRWEDELVDAFLADVTGEFGIEAMASALDRQVPEAMPPAALREAILSAARLEGRFDRFARVVAELLDVSDVRATELLDGIAREDVWESSTVPGVTLYHVEGGPKVRRAITGFVRMPAGTVFPEHRHLGDEAVLVVQGSFEDEVSGQIHRAGDLVRMPAGSAHGFRARPGPALVYLVVLDDGLQIGDAVFRPDDPEM